MEDISSHYKNLAETISLTCPTLEKFYINKSKLCNSVHKDDRKNIFNRCSFCLSIFSLNNRTLRLLPKPALNHKIEKLLHRQSTDPASLGKFQTKLVMDYVNGKNAVAVTCHGCKKTRKFAGQNRTERYQQKKYQERQTVLQMESEGVKISSRKMKKKERRKLMKRKKNAGEIEEDKNAGLTLPEIKTMDSGDAVIDGRSGQDQKDKIVKDKSNTEHSAKLQESLHLNRTEITDRGTGSFISERSPVSSATIHNMVLNTTKSQQKQTNIQTAENLQNITFPQTASETKSTNKKKKSKKMSLQLGSILKKEQRKQTGGTLADFLSSL